MPLTVEAIYENGVLKPAQPLPLKEREKVRVTVRPTTKPGRPRPDGLIGWKGDAADASGVLAEDEEEDSQEFA